MNLLRFCLSSCDLVLHRMVQYYMPKLSYKPKANIAKLMCMDKNGM